MARKLRLGCHLSIAQGLAKAAAMAAEVGADTFQFFTRNPRGGAARQIPAREIEAWQKARREQDLFPIVGHFPYTVNPAAPKEEVHRFARQCLYEDLRRCAAFGAEFLVLHPGSHVGTGAGEATRRIADALARAREGFEGDTWLLLETMSGQGSEVGGTLAELAAILDALGWPERVGVCLDSCHLFAAGWDLRRPEVVDELAADLDRRLGLERVRVLHLNDSKMALGSRRDRHEKVGQGQLGAEGLANLLAHPVLGQLPIVLETPVSDYREYADELRRASALVREGG